MDYNWREDVIDIIDNYDIPNDTKDNLLYLAGERIVEENGAAYYDCSETEAVMEEMGNIIGLFAVPLDSELYNLLNAWYGDEDKMMESVRNSFVDGENLYFVTGTGYSLFDADLLGGTGDGVTADQFDEFVRQQ